MKYRYSRLSIGGYVRHDSDVDIPVHCEGPSDSSPVHTTYPTGYDPRCSQCWLHIPHTETAHTRRINADCSR